MPNTTSANSSAHQIQNRNVAVLAYDGLCLFEFGVCCEIFGLKRPEMGNDWYSFAVTCLEPGRPLRASNGVTVAVDGGIDLLETAGTILIPGWSGVSDPVPEDLIEVLRRAHEKGARLLTICSGVFVLAACGLLDGHKVTTHWRYFDALSAKYPDLITVPNVLYTDNGQILTSAGSAAGIDLCLHLIRRDFGPAAANSVAKRLVVPPHREGGQAQFVDHSVPPPSEASRLSPLFEQIRTNLADTHTIKSLAQKVGMSERTFLRRFESATGTTPARWLTGLRVQKAKDLLEESLLSIDQIAEQTGFGTAATLRHHFREILGTAPTTYRRLFQSTSFQA
ncbi:transcriptional regulator FtrA [Labrenzia sp. PHM005]|uniref:transcriptional regulator FtrA n=1 Tax=Labrenzia sp. PHM005 TaxID=2590016 RepID=UPI001140165F|nr:transcriptional regulator FtrA [Labrenzia sp. PHM005]QDG77006.1 transcriptional regulator FtrA [Labrenzia sp. PHM005]